jgi:hypothetical protein
MIYRLYKVESVGPNTIEYESFDKFDFYHKILNMIDNYEVYYSPNAEYVTREEQHKLWATDFCDHGYVQLDGFYHHYVRCEEVSPHKDRDLYIREKLQEHYQEALTHGYEIFGIFVQGSQNYGLDIYNEEYWSDIDTKCIVLPSLDDIILNKKPISHTYERKNKEHIDFKDIRLMWDCFTKQNVNFMEILFTDYCIVPDKYLPYWNQMREMAEEITHAHPAQTVRTMSGMSMEKYKALEHRYPTIEWKIDKWGYDGKQLHHIIRINDFIRRYVTEMPFKEAMTPTSTMIPQMNEAKLNKYSLSVARELAKKYDDDSKRIKELFVTQYQNSEGKDIINQDIYDKMNQIKANIIKTYLIENLKGEANAN